jgi:hypothetical protein
MINHFKIKDFCVDENGNTDLGYATIETPNAVSPAMMGFLAGFLKKNINDVMPITKDEFNHEFKEEDFNDT